MVKISGPRGGTLKGAHGGEVKVDISLLNAASVVFDATYVPGGEKSAATLSADGRAIHFVNETYKHCKALAANGAGVKCCRLPRSTLRTPKGTSPFWPTRRAT